MPVPAATSGITPRPMPDFPIFALLNRFKNLPRTAPSTALVPDRSAIFLANTSRPICWASSSDAPRLYASLIALPPSDIASNGVVAEKATAPGTYSAAFNPKSPSSPPRAATGAALPAIHFPAASPAAFAGTAAPPNAIAEPRTSATVPANPFGSVSHARESSGGGVYIP